MARDEERMLRAQQAPIMGGLPEVPGIGVAMRLTPGLGVHLRGLADELLVNDLPGATVRRDQRDTRAAVIAEHGYSAPSAIQAPPCGRAPGIS